MFWVFFFISKFINRARINLLSGPVLAREPHV